METLVEKNGEVGGREERVVVGGLERDNEVFEEAIEQLPHVKAVAGDVNDEEVYASPVVDSVATSEVEGEKFEEAIEVTWVEDVNGDGNVHMEDVESVGGVKSGFVSGSKTYAEVLVEKLDDAGERNGVSEDINDVDNYGKTESLHLGNAVVVESEIHAVEGKETSVVDELGGQRSESSNSKEVESNNEESRLGGHTNGVLSVDGGHIEESKCGPLGSISSKAIDGVDQKLSSLAISGVDQEDAEGEIIIRAYTSRELGIEEDMPESYHARDAMRLAVDTSEDEDCEYDYELDPEDPHFQKSMAVMLKSIDSGTFKIPPLYDAIVGVPPSFCVGNAEVKEVDSQSLPHTGDDTTAESQVHVIEESVNGADHIVHDPEDANTMEDIVLVLDPRDATEEPSQGTTALKDSRVDQPDLATDFSSEPPSNAEIQDELHTVSDVTQSNQGSSEVLESKYVTEKELKQQHKVQEIPASVSNFLSEQPSGEEIQDKLCTTVSDVSQSNQASSEVLESKHVTEKEIKQQNKAREIPASVTDFLSEQPSEEEIQDKLCTTVSDVSQSNQASSEVLESKHATEKELKQQNKAQEIPASVTDFLSEQPSEAEIQGKLRTVSDVSWSNQASSEVLVRKELKPQNKVQERPASVPSSSSDKSPTLPVRPVGLGRTAPLLEPAPRAVQQPRVNGSTSRTQAQLVEEAANGDNEENDETREKLQMIRVKFLRLARRLGQTPHNVVVAQVLYRLGLAEQLRGRTGGRVAAFSFDRASDMAEQLEAVGQEPLDFSCTIMVLGKTGVGKSATINSIFDEVKFGTDAFQSGTKKVQDVVGTVHGIRVRVIDTPGLLTSWSDQSQNEKILQSVKQFIKKTPPDIVLYLDRLDMQSRELGDMLLLQTITRVFGPSIWFNAIVVLTHAGSAPPDGPNGTASNYDTFVTQHSHVVQHAVRQAAGDMRLMNPVSLVENHSACRTNRAGQRVLPNGQVWKPHLLLLSFASKILAEANTLLKLQDGPPGRPFVTRSRAPPLPYLLSSMLQSRPHLRLPEEQMGGDDSLDDDIEDSSGSEDDSEYAELPPFKPLTKAQLSNLSKAQKKAYYDELEYRENLLVKKQLKEEKLRRRMMKKMAAAANDMPKDYSETAEDENGAAGSVPDPMPDLALPASFDSDNPTHRYRYLDSSNPWLVRPVLETQVWDHDVGYEGINVERSFVVKEKVPLSFSGQITKDKKDANVQMEVAGTLKHGEGKATSVGLDLQTVGKDIAYTLRSESTFCNFLRNKATAGMSFTLLGDALSAGMKLEDKLITNKRFRMVLTGGAMTNRGDIAYGGSLEATLRDKDHPLGRSLSTLGLSVMDWHGDLAIGCNIQSQIPIGRHSNIIARANLNNKGSGQISIRLNSAEQLQITLVALLPLLRKAFSFLQESFQFQD